MDEPLIPGTKIYDGDRLVGIVDDDGNVLSREQWRDAFIERFVEEERDLLERLKDA